MSATADFKARECAWSPRPSAGHKLEQVITRRKSEFFSTRVQWRPLDGSNVASRGDHREARIEAPAGGQRR
jgi:hypothetical protein